MLNRLKLSFFSFACLLLVATGCKKGTFDINSPNPNLPSDVSPKYVLSSALTATAYSTYAAGFPDLVNGWMGYWAFSGDFGGYGTTATYNINSSTGGIPNNWDYVYNTILVNYKFIENASETDPLQGNYLAIAKIMEAYHFSRLVDQFGNIPYSEALKGGTLNYPKYDDQKTVYLAQIATLDSALLVLKNADPNAEDPGAYDVMFGGDMEMWRKFANTVKLQVLLNLTQTADGPALIKTELTGLTEADMLGAGEDASVNPGYSNASAQQQNPYYGNVGFTTGGSDQGNHDFYRANSYAVNFYKNTGDTWRPQLYYDTTSNGTVTGRAYGSLVPTEHNTVVSAIGPGLIGAATQSAPIIGAYESLFMQAEAAQRGYFAPTITVDSLYNSAVAESFRIVGVDPDSYAADANTYVNNGNVNTTWAAAADKIKLIVTQEWAALNQYDALQAWNNWRRLGIPANLPVSIYPGTSAPHVPIRYYYPQSETNTNGANVTAQGAINIQSTKIFWMP